MLDCSPSILIVGNWHWDIYEEALSSGLESHGWNVIRFDVSKYGARSSLDHFQEKLKLGPHISALNNALFGAFLDTLPTAVFFSRPIVILPRTLKSIKEAKPDTVLIIYHNDNPFLGLRNRINNRHFLKSIQIADVTLVYRPSNIVDAQQWGARNVSLFKPYYLSYRHKPMKRSAFSKNFNIIYIGHYEPDGRAETLNFLFNNGIEVRIFGSRWEIVRKKYDWLAAMDVHPVWGDEYTRLLSSAKIALVFLSHANRDVYSRRCFEITACGTMMLAPRTDELEQLFTDGKEAVYFDSKEDLLEKIYYYLKDDEKRTNIAQAGRRRCVKDGHDEISRTKQLIGIIRELRETQSHC